MAVGNDTVEILAGRTRGAWDRGERGGGGKTASGTSALVEIFSASLVRRGAEPHWFDLEKYLAPPGLRPVSLPQMPMEPQSLPGALCGSRWWKLETWWFSGAVVGFGCPRIPMAAAAFLVTGPSEELQGYCSRTAFDRKPAIRKSAINLSFVWLKIRSFPKCCDRYSEMFRFEVLGLPCFDFFIKTPFILLARAVIITGLWERR